MHIMYRRCNPGRFWLYVGQASKLAERISSHNNPIHRQAQPSLHYHVWDSAKDMVSKFVTLAVHIGTASKDDQLILNFQEMWMACIFQTMTAKHQADYLPANVNKVWAGQHLNVMPPRWQGFTGDLPASKEAIGGTKRFEDFLNSPDPAVRGWVWDIRHSFNDLRSSPDLVHRSHYFRIMAQNHKLAKEACQRKKVEDDTQGAHIISCSGFHFTISRHLNLGIKVGDQLRLQFHLTETRNPQMYATEALPTDPASRLAVSIKGQGIHGDYHVWLKNPGEKCVKRMNTLVDALEGVPLKESKGMTRR